MEEISVNGENYVKASSIARELGYTSDYVGQLCRSKQVEARLVGRSWYVKESSIRAHKEGRYRSTSGKSKFEVKRAINLLRNEAATPNYLKHNDRSARYETDVAPLYPSVSKPIESEITNKIKPIRINIGTKERDTRKLLAARDLQFLDEDNGKKPIRNDKPLGSTVISARSNRLSLGSELRIADNRPRRLFSGTSVKFAMFALLFIISITVIGASLTLESKVITSSEGYSQVVVFDTDFLEASLKKAFK